MQLMAKVTIQPGNVSPGEVFDIKDRDDAQSLIARGLAAPVEAAKKPAAKAGDAKPPAGGGDANLPPPPGGSQP
jgi:hypothetical protein